MPDQSLLQNLGIIVLAGTSVALITRGIRLPAIVAYIVAGLLLGPAFGIVEFDPTMDVIAEAGIILLLFLVGLELSLGKLREVGKIALKTGVAQMAMTSAGVAAIALAFGTGVREAVFLSVALTFSSTVVVVKLLDQLQALDSRHGRVAVGVLLVQDVAVLLVLTFVAGVRTGETPEPFGLILQVARAFGGMALLLAMAALAAWRVLPTLLRSVARSQAALLVWSLAWCFLVVSAAELLSLSLELGGFIAGVALAQLPYSKELSRRVHPLMDFFVAVFFVLLGARIELSAAGGAWPLVVALVAFTVLGKPLIVAALAVRSGESRQVALSAGISLGQTSEFSFILAGLAVASGLASESALAVVGMVGLLTMGVSAILIPPGHRLLAGSSVPRALKRFVPTRFDLLGEAGASPQGPPSRSGHVVVIGMNSLGRRIVEFLIDRGERVLAVDTDLEKLRDLPCPVLLGNAEYLAVLDDAGLPNARMLVSALHIEEVNRLLAYRASRLEIPSVIHAHDQAAEQELQRLGVAHVLDSRQAGVARTIEALSELGIFGR